MFCSNNDNSVGNDEALAGQVAGISRAMTTCKGHIQPGHVPEQKTGVVKNAKIHYH